MREKLSENPEMVEARVDAIRAEGRAIVMSAASPVQPGDSVKVRIHRAARRLGLKPSRAKSYWYGEITNPPAAEIEAMRRKIGSTRKEIEKAQAMLVEAKRGINETNSELGGPHAGPCDAMVVALAEAMLRLAEKLTEGE